NGGIATHDSARVNGGCALIARATVANGRDPTTTGQHFQIVAEIDVGQHLHNDVNAMTFGEAHDLLQVSCRRVVQHVMGTLFEHQFSPTLRPCRADDRHASSMGELHGRNAHTTTSTMD